MEIIEKSQNAAKWSLVTEIVSKIVSPITNMILARLLTPDAFGMVATVTMVVSFADLFTDAGFSKYIIQHDFKDDLEQNKACNVTFWTNLIISLLIWSLIALFRDNIASSVGNPGLGNALLIASLAIPATAFASVQSSLLKRTLRFRRLFFLRLPSIFIPIVVTVPLAFFMRSFWAMIIGTLIMSIVNAAILTIYSNWRPSFSYSFETLKKIIPFSMWTMAEQLLGWANLNIGIFIVGIVLTPYYVGLYKTSMAVVNQLYAIIINSFSPVLLSTLSRLNNDLNQYRNYYYDFIKYISIIMIPLGVGLFVFRDFATAFLLGSQWTEAADFVGLWALARSIWCIFGIFSTVLFISSGKPKYSVYVQTFELLVLAVSLLLSAQYGYDALFISRSAIVVVYMIFESLLAYVIIAISPSEIIKKVYLYATYALIMGVIGFMLLKYEDSFLMSIIWVAVCVLVYMGLVLFDKRARADICYILKTIRK